MFSLTSLIGTFAAILTTISFVPQAIKTIKTQDTSGISLAMYLMFVCGVFLWLVYGFLIIDKIIIIANSITLILAGSVLVVKILNLKKKAEK
jgi:MtN3 and saliva related transmembrane protein